METETKADGIHAMVPYEQMCEGAKKIRDFYDMKPGVPLYKKEFGYYCLERWYEQGLDRNANLAEEFDYDPGGIFRFGGLGCDHDIGAVPGRAQGDRLSDAPASTRHK